MALLSLFDHLYCQEEILVLEEEEGGRVEPVLRLPEDCETGRHLLSAEEEWAEVLCSLAAKEGEALPELVPDGGDSYLRSARKGAVEWVVRTAARHSFSALTVLLAVDYLDRCFLSCAGGGRLLRLQGDKPWMGRLTAVACLSLATKVEETRVPHLLDLQVPSPPEAVAEEKEVGYVFEPKTIRRMELLVLSALGWRMNPVTPLSFVHHLLPRLCSKDKSTATDSAAAGIAARTRELARRCEAVLLSAITDGRWVQYPASVWAAAALLQATESGVAAAESQASHHLISLLNAPKGKLQECRQLILESVGTGTSGHKRKHFSSFFYYYSSPPSPSGVIGSCFSCESSCDSWAMWPSSASSSPEIPLFKRLNGTRDEGAREEGAASVPVQSITS